MGKDSNEQEEEEQWWQEGAADWQIPDDAMPVCVSCLEEVPHDQALFCPRCGSPQDQLATILFFERTLADGYILRELFTASPRGLWRILKKSLLGAAIGGLIGILIILPLLILISRIVEVASRGNF